MSASHILIFFILISFFSLLGINLNAMAKDVHEKASEIPELNDDLLNSTLKEYPLFVLDCYSPGCEPCTIFNSTIPKLSIELGKQVTFGRINMRENKQTKKRYNIKGYPTLLIFKNGTLINRQLGYRTKSEFVGLLKQSVPVLDISHVNLTG